MIATISSEGFGILANDAQFFSDNPACRVQLRRLLATDLAGQPRHGATAVLRVNAYPRDQATHFTIRAERTRVKNSRSGVMHALTCLERLNPVISREIRAIADAQTVWGEP